MAFWKPIRCNRHLTLTIEKRTFWLIASLATLFIILYLWATPKQLREHKRNTVKNNEPPCIALWWNHFKGSDIFYKFYCNYKKCFLTGDRNLLSKASAIFFYGTDMNWNDLPLPRKPNQIWALFHEESPRNQPGFMFEEIFKHFNYTSTFSRYSDFPLVTNELKNIELITDPRLITSVGQKNNLRSTNLAPVIFLQTDCATMSGRTSYVEDLMKYITIDSYGACLNNREMPKNVKKNSQPSIACNSCDRHENQGMPRHRSTNIAHVDLADLIERAQQHQRHRHPHNRRSSKIHSRPTHTNMFPVADNERSRSMRSRCRRRNTVIDVGRDAVWNTLVQPVSLLQWLPMRRTFRIRRSYRSRSRRSQRSNGAVGSGSAVGVGGVPTEITTPKIGSQERMPTAEIEMPCCATESPTAEVQMISKSREQCQQQHNEHEQQRDDQPTAQHVFTPPLSTVILHQNPLFDAEGNTRSGLIAKNIQKAQIESAKSRWNVRGADKTPSNKKFANGDEPKDVARKKSAAEKRVPAKKTSGTDESSAASVNPSDSRTTVESGASSEKSKSYTDESNSFEESIDLTMHEELSLNLDNVSASTTLLEAISENAQDNGPAIKRKNFETMLAK